jgi:hypothetical protein
MQRTPHDREALYMSALAKRVDELVECKLAPQTACMIGNGFGVG